MATTRITIPVSSQLTAQRETPFVEGSSRRLRYHLAEGVSVGKICGFVGLGAAEPGSHRVDRRRRSVVAEGAQLSHVGLPNRRWAQAAVMDWQGSHDQDLPAVLPNARQRTFGRSEIRLQRHVEAVPESDCQKSQPGDPRARPISHHAEDEPSDRHLRSH